MKGLIFRPATGSGWRKSDMYKVLLQVQNVIDMPANDKLSLFEASR